MCVPYKKYDTSDRHRVSLDLNIFKVTLLFSVFFLLLFLLLFDLNVKGTACTCALKGTQYFVHIELFATL